jgi:hypothetical protein
MFDMSYIPPEGKKKKNERIRTARELALAVQKRIREAKAEHARERVGGVGEDGQHENHAPAVDMMPDDIVNSPYGGCDDDVISLLHAMWDALEDVRLKDPEVAFPLPGVQHAVNSAMRDIATGGIRTVVAVVGENGLGKTFIINLWLAQTMADFCSYERWHAGMDMPSMLARLEALTSLQMREAVYKRKYANALPAVKIRLAGDGVTWQCDTKFELPTDDGCEERQVKISVRPEGFPVDLEEEDKAFWQKIEHYYKQGYAGPKGLGKGYILLSKEDGRVTTPFRTRIRYSNTIHFMVEFLPRAALVRKLQDFMDILKVEYAHETNKPVSKLVEDALGTDIEDLNGHLEVYRQLCFKPPTSLDEKASQPVGDVWVLPVNFKRCL